MEIVEFRGHYEVGLQLPGIRRPLLAGEPSDGTLRDLCRLGGGLIAADLDPRGTAVSTPPSHRHRPPLFCARLGAR